VAKLGKNFPVCDPFFHAAFGGSFLNHMWLIAARTPVFPSAPADMVEPGLSDAGAFPVDDAGAFTSVDKAVSPDGYIINTSFSVNTPHPLNVAADHLGPNQTFATIGDRLSDKGVDWAWYSGGWNHVLAYIANDGGVPEGGVSPSVEQFQYHHQPFVYFEKYKDGTAAKTQHLKDEEDFLAAVTA